MFSVPRILLCQKTFAMAETSRITLEKNNDISKVEQLHERLESLLEAACAVDIDASAVERIDTSTLQVLTAFVGTMGKHHLNARIVRPSQGFLDAVRLMGLQQSLRLND